MCPLYRFKTIIYDCKNKPYKKKHKTEAHMNEYVQSMLNKNKCVLCFFYDLFGTDNRFPFIQKF